MLEHGKILILCCLVPIFFDLKVKVLNLLEYLIDCTIYFKWRMLHVIAIINYQNYMYHGKFEKFAETAEIGKHVLFLKSNFLPSHVLKFS